MSFSTDAHGALKHAERQVREAAAKALLAGEYDRATELIGTAQQLANLVASAEQADANGLQDAVSTKSSTSSLDHQSRAKAPVSAKRVGYPRFSRDGNQLVKTGWSKTAKAEYEHRCPENVFRLLLSAMRSTAARKKVFAVEDILPNSKYVPAYQAYLVVAWLRAEGLVAQHGRRGYTIDAPNDWEVRADRAWQQLSSYTPRS